MDTSHQESHIGAENAISSIRPELDILKHQEALMEPAHAVRHAHEVAAPTGMPVLTVAAATPALPKEESRRPAPSDTRHFSPEVTQPYARTRGESIFWIDVEKIEPNPYQPRREFSDDALSSLADSIRVHGVLQPVVVSKVELETPRGLDVRYQLIAGERRWRASRLAGLREIPAVVKREVTPERQKLEWAIIENVQREDLNPVERGRAFRQLMDDFKLTQSAVAERVGKSREYVANMVRLMTLPENMQESLRVGEINEGHARAILALNKFPENQQKLFEETRTKQLNVRDVELATRAILGNRRPTKRRNALFLDPEVRMVQNRLEETLGTKVLFQKEGERGKIIVEFYSEEELRAILDKMIHEA